MAFKSQNPQLWREMCYLLKVMLFNRCISLFVFVCCLCGSPSVSAQFNFGVGFSLGSVSAKENSAILEAYNLANQSQLEEPYPDLKLMSGVFVSLRYRTNSTAFELSWENLERDINSVLVFDDKTGQVDNLYYNLTSTSLGVENHIGQFGYGAAIASRLFTVKADIINTDFKRKLDRSREFSTKLFLLYTIQKSRLISVELKPFVQIPLASISLGGLAEELNVVPAQDSNTTSPFLYGITLVFYNGRQ